MCDSDNGEVFGRRVLWAGRDAELVEIPVGEGDRGGFGVTLTALADHQLARFKQDPAARIWGRPAATLEGRLLISGFWGIGRHLNYTGEILVYLALWILMPQSSPSYSPG